jgi:hypothetical protein
MFHRVGSQHGGTNMSLHRRTPRSARKNGTHCTAHLRSHITAPHTPLLHNGPLRATPARASAHTHSFAPRARPRNAPPYAGAARELDRSQTPCVEGRIACIAPRQERWRGRVRRAEGGQDVGLAHWGGCLSCAFMSRRGASTTTVAMQSAMERGVG